MLRHLVGRFHAVLVALVGVTLFGAGAGPVAASEPGFTIAREDGRVVVQATEADVETVVADLGRRGGFDLTVLTGAERSPVNGTIRGGSISEVLRKILRRRNYTLVYDASGHRLERVVLLSPPPEKRWVPKPTVAASGQRHRDRQREIEARRRRETQLRHARQQRRQADYARRSGRR